jgi:hypothetical protein
MSGSLNCRRLVVVCLLWGGVAAATPCQAQEYCEEECVETCDTCPRPSLCFAIARHLKLQSVYFCRKVTRPYRRIADVPPELGPHVGPSLPPNAYTHPAAYGVGTHTPGWTGNSMNSGGYPAHGDMFRYTP